MRQGRGWNASLNSRVATYYRTKPPRHRCTGGPAVEPLTVLDFNLHSPSRQLIELRIAHADLNATIDRLGEVVPQDELLMRRLKKRRLALRDQIARVERAVEPQEPA